MRRGVALLFLLAACAAPKEQPLAARTEPPAFYENHFSPGDGALLPLRHSLPKRGKPKAVIVALHGFGDYSHAFALPAAYLAKRGIALYAYDQRGFGATPHTGIWPGEENLVGDARAALAAAHALHPDAPVYLLGESMGGAAALLTAASSPEAPLAGYILSAPALWGGSALAPFLRVPLWVVAHTAPDSRLSGDGLELRPTDNLEILRAMSADPLVHKDARADTVYYLVGMMDHAYETARAAPPSLRLPGLILYGEHDEIVPPAPVSLAAESLAANACFLRYEEGYHLLLRDRQAKKVWRDIADWVLHGRDDRACGGDPR